MSATATIGFSLPTAREAWTAIDAGLALVPWPDPSMDDLAERAGVEHRGPDVGEHFMGDDLTVAAYWPGDPP